MELRSQPPRLHAHDRIVSRIEGVVLPEHLHPHDELLQPLAATRDCLLDDEAQEPLEPVRLPERLAGKNAIQLARSAFVKVLAELRRGAPGSHRAMIRLATAT